MNENKTNINWFPGHMAKTKRQISEVINVIDIVYEVIDARIPYSSKIVDIDNLLKNKKKILIMTKKDLCNIEKTNKWKKYYESKGYKVLILDLLNNKDFINIVNITKEFTKDIQEKRKEKGLKPKDIKALVIGIPNVGKSTLINKLAGKKVQVVGDKPGVTKNLNFLNTKYDITLLDTPGILWPKFEDQNVALNLASIGSIKKEILNLNDIATHILNIYLNNYPNIIKEFYKSEKSDILEIMDDIARHYGFIKQGEIEYNLVYEKIYNDLAHGKVLGITLDIWK